MIHDVSKNKLHIVLNALPLVFLVAFYLLFTIKDGVVMCMDSPSYIRMSLSREPFYPTFLAALRAIFGENSYLLVAVYIQGLLAAVCSFSLISYLKKAFNLNELFTWGFTIITVMVSLLCRYAAKRGSMYSNSILTEGICLPLFMLFMRFAFEYVVDAKKRALVGAAITSFILISSRKQMYLTLILLIICIVYRELIKKPEITPEEENKSEASPIKRFLLTLISVVVLIVGANQLFENVYSIALHGENSTHFNDNRFLATMLFYVSDLEDGELIREPEVKALYEEIYAVCDAEGDMLKYAGGHQISSHFEEHYDMIQIDHMWPMLEEYAANVYPDNDIARETLVDETVSIMIDALLSKNVGKVLYVFVNNLLQGFANTVAKYHPVLNIYALLIGVIYIALLIYGLKKRGLTKSAIFALLVLLSTLGNVAIVAMLIFCQTRYMIYNMALFYIALGLMLKEDFDILRS